MFVLHTDVIAGRAMSMQKDGLIPDEINSLSCSVSTSLALHVPQEMLDVRGELLGVLQEREVTDLRLQQQAGSKAEANALQVKVELQADCLSGVWVNREEQKRPGFLEAGDIDAALTTASAIGDDTLQRQATGRVVPDSFTHGSAAQRKQWFMTGYQQGTVQACNTFGAGAL